MDERVIKTKCTNCGSGLKFNPKKGCLTCSYCESNYFLPKTNDDAVLVRQYSSSFTPNDLNHFLKSCQCQTCGNIYYFASDETSKKCPNCGNSNTVLVDDKGYIADGILPFKIGENEAKKLFEKHIKSQFGLSKSLKSEAIKNGISGVYVPVWNFMYDVSAIFSAVQSELHTRSDGTYYSIKKPIYGERHKTVKSFDVSSVSGEDESFLDLFDEVDYANIIPFTPEYSYGFKILKVDKDIHQYYYDIVNASEENYKIDIKKELDDSGKNLSNVEISAKAMNVFFNFLYVPVYENVVFNKGKPIRTYINGLNGKIIGSNSKKKGKLKKLLKFVLLVGLIGVLFYLFQK